MGLKTVWCFVYPLERAPPILYLSALIAVHMAALLWVDNRCFSVQGKKSQLLMCHDVICMMEGKP